MTRLERVSLIALGGWASWLLAFVALTAIVRWMGFDVGEFPAGGIVFTFIVGGLLSFGLAIACSVEEILRYRRALRL